MITSNILGLRNTASQNNWRATLAGLLQLSLRRGLSADRAHAQRPLGFRIDNHKFSLPNLDVSGADEDRGKRRRERRIANHSRAASHNGLVVGRPVESSHRSSAIWLPPVNATKRIMPFPSVKDSRQHQSDFRQNVSGFIAQALLGTVEHDAGTLHCFGRTAPPTGAKSHRPARSACRRRNCPEELTAWKLPTPEPDQYP